MRPRKLLNVRDMPLVGGALCLDFVNTTGARSSGESRERLAAIGDVRVWARRAGIRGGRPDSTGSSPARARQALKRLLALRETLYRIFRALVENRPPRAADIDHLNRWSRADRLGRELVFARNGLELRPLAGSGETDRWISAVIDSALGLLQSKPMACLKRCAECDWLFVDETKNRSRTWCKKTCGDRVRARRHYARLKPSRDSHLATLTVSPED
jgi:predicted RNA-binding Zn ribbon-like protein